MEATYLPPEPTVKSLRTSPDCTESIIQCQARDGGGCTSVVVWLARNRRRLQAPLASVPEGSTCQRRDAARSQLKGAMADAFRGRWRMHPRQSGIPAVTVISTKSSGEFSMTSTVVLAGLLVGKYLAYSSL
jgi:hypothetical protein